MKKFSMDQTAAWLFSIFLSLGLFLTGYLSIGHFAKTPDDRKKAFLEELEHNPELAKQFNHDDHEKQEHKDEHHPVDKHGHAEKHTLILDKDEVANKKESEHNEGSSHAAPADHKRIEQSTENASWSYKGKTGPDFWSKLSSDYTACRLGREQSPIDLNHGTVGDKALSLNFNYHKSLVAMEDNGNFVRLEYLPGNELVWDEHSYSLLYTDFHIPSEHTIDGIPYDMEMQFLHRDHNGEIVILTVFLLEEGKSHPEIGEIWSKIPNKKGIKAENVSIDPKELLPQTKDYYYYDGSLTTPPCTEGVQWIVLNKPIKVSSKQIDRFISRYRNNARPIQAINKRTIYKLK